MPNLITATLDGKNIAFHDETVFIVQVGKGKSAYRTRFSVTGDLARACFLYRCLNIGNGFKKRLIAPSLNRPLLARYIS